MKFWIKLNLLLLVEKQSPEYLVFGYIDEDDNNDGVASDFFLLRVYFVYEKVKIETKKSFPINCT